jgi:transcriptional regulator with XRE-family HTH domain
MTDQMGGLRSLRERKMLTQQELAAEAGLTITTISRIETGKVNPSLRTIRALARVLDCNPQELRYLLGNDPKGQRKGE